jgi:hypothetical protein
MDKKTWEKILHENTLNEKKNDFVATGETVLISIHNSPDEDANIKLYNRLVSLLKKMKNKPKKIDITY